MRFFLFFFSQSWLYFKYDRLPTRTTSASAHDVLSYGMLRQTTPPRRRAWAGTNVNPNEPLPYLNPQLYSSVTYINLNLNIKLTIKNVTNETCLNPSRYQQDTTVLLTIRRWKSSSPTPHKVRYSPPPLLCTVSLAAL